MQCIRRTINAIIHNPMNTKSIIDILINADRNETSTLVKATRKAITIAQAISITSK